VGSACRWSPSRQPQRDLIEHSIGPIWEANHVWLIFVITLFWTTFPAAFAPFAATLYIPLTLAALGIIGRGAAFAFRKVSNRLSQIDRDVSSAWTAGYRGPWARQTSST
jgi:cytochrome bd-type quinol oxidase subunit 2